MRGHIAARRTRGLRLPLRDALGETDTACVDNYGENSEVGGIEGTANENKCEANRSMQVVFLEKYTVDDMTRKSTDQILRET